MLLPDGGANMPMRPGVGENPRAGVFRVDAAFDGVAAFLQLGVNVLLPPAQLLAAGDAELLLDQVQAGHHLGDGMFDLQARIDFHEVELAGVEVVDELDGAGVGRTWRFSSGARRPAACRSARVCQSRARRTATPRSVSGCAAGWCSRVRQDGPHCRVHRPAPALRRGARFRSIFPCTACRRRKPPPLRCRPA